MEENLSTEEDVTEEKYSAHKFSFPKSHRLRKRYEYSYLFKNRKRLVGEYIRIDYLFFSGRPTRLGMTVSTRYGKSHVRNRFKRSVREAFRHMYPSLPKNLTINVFPRRKAQIANICAIKAEMKRLIDDISK